MSSTYLQLTNKLLRRLNEVEIDTADFTGARNVQALAKDAVNASIREIISYVQQWPFLLTVEEQTLTAGTQEYSFPSDMHVVDWDSFFLKKDAAIDTNAKELNVISYDEYQSRHRASDANMVSTSYAQPERIYRTQQSKFGVSPPPDKAYTVQYTYFSFPTDLSTATDTTIIPPRFEHVLIEGAMVFMMRFRSNDSAVAYHLKKFQEGLEFMRRVLLDPPDYFRANAQG
jgi:hypothetical protein